MSKNNNNNDVRGKNIDSIEKALEEKLVRETQNLELQIEKDRLCAQMKHVDAINDILNSTSRNEIGCPQYPEYPKYQSYDYKCGPQCSSHDCDNIKKNEDVGNHSTHQIEYPVSSGIPKIFQGKKKKVYLTFMWIILIVLAVGWSPGGEWFKQVQESYVNILVDFFKMGLFALAGFFTYKVVKEDE